MRILALLPLLALALVFGSCDTGSFENEATSQVQVFNGDATGLLIASGSQRGAITLDHPDSRQLRVMRRVSDPDEGTTTVNVTQDVDYNVSNTAVIDVGDNETANAGLITTLSPGTATIEVIYHDPEDPTKSDNTFIDVLVTQ